MSCPPWSCPRGEWQSHRAEGPSAPGSVQEIKTNVARQASYRNSPTDRLILPVPTTSIRSTLTCMTRQHHDAVLAVWTVPGDETGLPLLTLHCSASVRRTSVEAEPSRRNRPSVSFSRHMSRMALAVFPVSFREWTNTSTYRGTSQEIVRDMDPTASPTTQGTSIKKPRS